MRRISPPALLVAAGLLAALVLPIAASAVPAPKGPASAFPVAEASTSAPVRISGAGSISSKKKTVVNMRSLRPEPAPANTGPIVSIPDGQGLAERSKVKSAPAANSSPTPTAQSKLAAQALTTQTVLAVQPLVPTVAKKFDGIGGVIACGNCTPPDPNVAVGSTQIVEIVNNRVQVYTKVGAIACPGASTITFFGGLASDTLGDGRVIYDSVNDKFTMSVTIATPGAGTAIMRMASSTTGDACGNWITFPINNIGNFAPGNFMDQPALGQDRNSILYSAQNFGTNGFYYVAALPKACIYSSSVSCGFDVFRTTHYAVPVSNGGVPMTGSFLTYFLSSVPGVGYELYEMTASDSPHPSVAPKIVISSPFTAPTRDAVQPGSPTNIGLGITGGDFSSRIKSTPIWDGNRIWFTHGMNLAGHPAIRYGNIDPSSNAIHTSVAYHSGSSDDFNPSLTVGVNVVIGGVLTTELFLNWAYTDSNAGFAVSAAVATVSIPDPNSLSLITGDTTLVAGSVTADRRFGDYSSMSLDPSVASGRCAVSAQEYFDNNGRWATSIARFGTC